MNKPKISTIIASSILLAIALVCLFFCITFAAALFETRRANDLSGLAAIIVIPAAILTTLGCFVTTIPSLIINIKELCKKNGVVFSIIMIVLNVVVLLGSILAFIFGLYL